MLLKNLAQKLIKIKKPSLLNRKTKFRFESIDLIKDFEGLKLDAYKCSAGVWTIGYGSTYGVHRGDTITLTRAEELLLEDLEPFCADINKLVKVDLNQNQFDALVSLCYNIGTGNFKNSTLLRLLNAGNFGLAAEQFHLWRRAKGKILQGLVNRRKREYDLFID